MDGLWEPTGWWRVIGPDGGLWCETSVQQEAIDCMRPGDTLQAHYERCEVQWRTVDTYPRGSE